MFKRANSQLFITIFYLIVLSSVIVLGVLQLDWVSQASKRQLDFAQKNLALEITKTIDTTSKELHDRLLKAISGTPEEDALFSQYQSLEYNKGWPDYSEDDPRAAIAAELSLDIEPAQSSLSSLIHHLNRLQESNQLALLEIRSFKGDAINSHFIVHLVTINEDQFINSHFVNLIKSNLQNYHFILSNNGETLYSSLASKPDTKPEVTVSMIGGLRVPILQRIDGVLQYRENRVNRQENTENTLLNSPDIFAFYDRVLNSITADAQPDDYGNGMVLQVYAPDGRLKDNAKKHQILNSILSTSILVLISITALVLILATRKLQNLRNRERDFVVTVSHELRTPLTVISSAADNLKSGIVNKPESINRYGEEIAKQSKRLERMIESTLFYSGLPQQNRIKLTHVTCADYFRETLAPLKQLTSNQNTQFKTTESYISKSIRIDTDALRLIIENLVMNAVIHGKHNRAKR